MALHPRRAPPPPPRADAVADVRTEGGGGKLVCDGIDDPALLAEAGI
jgi:hypothetical protein